MQSCMCMCAHTYRQTWVWPFARTHRARRTSMASSARSTSHTLVHNVQAPGPALKNDLALLASLSVDSLRAFCETARAQLRGGAEQESAAATYRKAARQLGVEAGAVEAAVNALCYIIASAVAAGRGAEQLLDQDFELPALGAEAQDALREDKSSHSRRIARRI